MSILDKLSPKVKSALTGAIIAAAYVLGTALVKADASQAIHLKVWLHDLILAEAGAMGSYITNLFGASVKQAPPPTP